MYMGLPDMKHKGAEKHKPLRLIGSPLFRSRLNIAVLPPQHILLAAPNDARLQVARRGTEIGRPLNGPDRRNDPGFRAPRNFINAASCRHR